MAPEIIVALCSLAGTLLGSIGGIIVSSKLTNYRLKQLEHKVDKHNCLVERMALVERDDKAQWRAIEEIKEKLT